MTDTPDIANFEALQRLDALFLRINHAYTLISLVFLTITACHLRQSLCRCNAHCNRDACTLSDGLYNLPAVGNQFLSFSETGEIQERFINRVLCQFWRELGQQHHYPAAHVTIQIVVGTENSHIVCLQDVTDLIERCPHLDAHCLDFVASGHDTAVIVRENNDRFVTKLRIEHALT